MLLLIVNELLTLEKKDLYLVALPVNDIITAATIKEAGDIITEHKDDINLCLINNVLIENNNDINIEELRTLSCLFDGSIIVRVDSDSIGLMMLKFGLISEYYVASNDKEVELERLKKAFHLASIKNRIVKKSCEIKNNLEIVKTMG